MISNYCFFILRWSFDKLIKWFNLIETLNFAKAIKRTRRKLIEITATSALYIKKSRKNWNHIWKKKFPALKQHIYQAYLLGIYQDLYKDINVRWQRFKRLMQSKTKNRFRCNLVNAFHGFLAHKFARISFFPLFLLEWCKRLKVDQNHCRFELRITRVYSLSI